jgi:hypothetical protein
MRLFDHVGCVRYCICRRTDQAWITAALILTNEISRDQRWKKTCRIRDECVLILFPALFEYLNLGENSIIDLVARVRQLTVDCRLMCTYNIRYHVRIDALLLRLRLIRLLHDATLCLLPRIRIWTIQLTTRHRRWARRIRLLLRIPS